MRRVKVPPPSERELRLFRLAGHIWELADCNMMRPDTYLEAHRCLEAVHPISWIEIELINGR